MKEASLLFNPLTSNPLSLLFALRLPPPPKLNLLIALFYDAVNLDFGLQVLVFEIFEHVLHLGDIRLRSEV